MRFILKKILLAFPYRARIRIVLIREAWNKFKSLKWEQRAYPSITTLTPNRKKVRNLMIYHLNGLSHGGTEKNLQLIANSLANQYQVFFMYGENGSNKDRVSLLDKQITLIPFHYSHNEVKLPHKLHGMQPHIKEVLTEHEIDLIITASPGYAHYPWNTITDTPIILSNVFGAPSLQKNIVHTIFMSETVRKHAEEWTGPQTNSSVRYLSLNAEPPENYRALGTKLREKLDIKPNDFVFGRIGRDSDKIFDPITIKAWKKIATKYPNSHLLIMSPPPILEKIVQERNIPRVHFIPPSSAENDVWAFHGAINCFAHFRKDGETSGVAIAESLCVGNPVITHRSRIWNAHLEYLDKSCARVADIDNDQMYSEYMEEFIKIHENNPKQWSKLSANALRKGNKNFSPSSYKEFIKEIVTDVLK